MERQIFGRLADGRPVEKIILKNENGMTGQFLNYGCRIAKLEVPDRGGNCENVILGHDTLAEYEAPSDVHGAVIGRFANRIGGAAFSIGTHSYQLQKNEGENILHSASSGFQKRLWQVEQAKDGNEPFVTFSLRSTDGDGGFPGNLQVQVTYTLTENNALRIDYRAKTDAETPLNLTNHSFFNLTGDASKSILGISMRVFSNAITETGNDLIPTGKLFPVEGTPYDFHRAKPIGRDIDADDPLLIQCGGYDVNYVLENSDGLKQAGELFEPESGRRLRVYTDLPGMQVYTANHFPAGAVCCGNVELKPHHAVCLETQYFPDSPHHPEFPYQNLKPDVPFHSTTVYRFDCL
ncbi:MAG: galactose mutarotase [Oscillospiraceae bacterium]|jgi:aldose 1-epimerase|nr:galactose mutarotase [Oscillospiraceae bacterium]